MNAPLQAAIGQSGRRPPRPDHTDEATVRTPTSTAVTQGEVSLAETIRREQSLCHDCGRRLVRRGDVTQCPRCEMMTRHHDPAVLDEADASDGSQWCRDLVGTRLGDFRLQTLLGEGASGAVFLAQHAFLQRRSAVKILAPSLASEFDFGERFLNEARLASSLADTNVVTTHAVGATDVPRLGRVHWIEQELVPGRSLQDYLDRWTLAPTEAARLLVDIASGLAAAHRSGLLHRDIKPDNVLLTHCRTAKLGDFGLAQPVDATDRGWLVGTPNFMAPELFEDAAPSPASDVYSLGATFFTMLAGHPPFADECTTLDELSATVRTRNLPSVRRLRDDVSLEMAECLAILTSRSLQNRPVDGIEALQLIQSLLGHVRDLETLVRDAMQDEPCVDWRRLPSESGERFELDVHLPGGRCQRVFLEETDGTYCERTVRMDSLCGPVCSGHLESALRMNATIAHGALAIREHEGSDYFVMVDTYPRGTLDAEEVRRSVWELAVYADQMELDLTQQDRF